MMYANSSKIFDYSNEEIDDAIVNTKAFYYCNELSVKICILSSCVIEISKPKKNMFLKTFSFITAGDNFDINSAEPIYEIFEDEMSAMIAMKNKYDSFFSRDDMDYYPAYKATILSNIEMYKIKYPEIFV